MRKQQPCRSTRLTCLKCGASVDIPGDARHVTQTCVVFGCDGVMRKYKPHCGAWQKPQTLTADAAITRPNSANVNQNYQPKPHTFRTYEEYLASDLWQHIRGAVYRRDKGLCRICHGAGSQVHHLSYDKEVMEGRRLQDLVLLCRPCHERIEFTKRGVKRSTAAAAEMFWQLTRDTSQKPRKRKHPHHRKKRHKTDPIVR
jgi:hypothetical protein